MPPCPGRRDCLDRRKQKAGQPWQIWEVPLAGGAPPAVDLGRGRLHRPFYAAERKFVYARRTASGFQIEIAPLAGGAALRLTYLTGNFLPDAILRDGRCALRSGVSGGALAGSGALHRLRRRFRSGSPPLRPWAGPALGAELASGTPSFRPARGWRRFTSARAGQLELALPKGQYVGPVAETGRRRVAGGVSRGRDRRILDLPFPAAGGAQAGEGGRAERLAAGARCAPGQRPRITPRAWVIREGANLLCLDALIFRNRSGFRRARGGKCGCGG